MPTMFWMWVGLVCFPVWFPAEPIGYAKLMDNTADSSDVSLCQRGRPPSTCGDDPHPCVPAVMGMRIDGPKPASDTGGFG
jgi:hypothetical protein